MYQFDMKLFMKMLYFLQKEIILVWIRHIEMCRKQFTFCKQVSSSSFAYGMCLVTHIDRTIDNLVVQNFRSVLCILYFGLKYSLRATVVSTLSWSEVYPFYHRCRSDIL